MKTPAQSAPSDTGQVGAVVVTFQPGADFEERLIKMAKEVSRFVIVDNSEDGASRDRIANVCARRNWDLVSSGTNEGVATALNKGVQFLAGRGFRWALLLDQDSEPAADMCEQLIASWQRRPDASSLAIIGPTFLDAATGRPHRVLRRHPQCGWWFQKASVKDTDLPNVSMVITSGSLLRVEAFSGCGGFDDGLFIDYVDTDFCLKCLQCGWTIAVSARARMEHRLGGRDDRRWMGLRVHPTNHSPLRHYYISRNRIAMWRRHASRCPHWAWFDLAALGLWIFRILAVENHKAAKLAAMGRGTWDGLRGRTGRARDMEIALAS